MYLKRTAWLNYNHYENTPIQIYRKFQLWYFYISAQNIDFEYSLEPPRRSGSNEYPQSMFFEQK